MAAHQGAPENESMRARVLVAITVVAAAALLVAAAAGRTPARGPWDGTWSTSKGAMTLVQKGSRVTGTYFHDDGKIEGTAIGLTFSGRWSEEPTYAGPGDAGPVVLQIDLSGLQFKGKWAYEGQTPSRSWTGIRAET
jgi:hypothetical protein